MKKLQKKKTISLMLALGLSLLPRFSQAQFTERLYCKIGEDSVRIYLFPEENTFKCKIYRTHLQKALQESYSEITQVITALNRGDDISYWKELYEQKKEIFLKLFALRQRIENAIDDFSIAFLEKSQNFLAPALQEKLQQLKAQKEDLQNQLLLGYSEYLNQKLMNIAAMEQTILILQKSKNLDHFMAAFEGYFTLLKKI